MSNIISGNVTVAGASVFCTSVPAQGTDGRGVALQTTSALNGDYSFSGLLSGRYRVTAYLAGLVFTPKIAVISPLFVTEAGLLSDWTLATRKSCHRAVRHNKFEFFSHHTEWFAICARPNPVASHYTARFGGFLRAAFRRRSQQHRQYGRNRRQRRILSDYLDHGISSRNRHSA